MTESKKSLLDNFLFLLFLAALAVSLFLKLSSILNNNVIITYDQGRDLIDIREIMVKHRPKLIGPTTSINGVMLGPVWYYFNLIPFAISGGNPNAIAIWQIVWYEFSAILLYFVLKKVDKKLASITSILFLLLPTGFNTGRYFWNANAMPFFTALYFSAFIWSITKSSRLSLFLLGLISGLSLQIEAAFGILFFPVTILYFWLNKTGAKKILFLLSGFLITLIPQFIFEIRHNFMMSRILISQLTGKSNILGQKLLFSERLDQRVTYFFNSLRDTNHIPFEILKYLYLFLPLLFLFFLFSGKVTKEIKRYLLMLVSFFIFSSVFYLIFPQPLKVWYTLGYSVLLVLFLGLFVFSLTLVKTKLSYISVAFLFLIIFSSFFYSYKAQAEYFRNYVYQPSGNASLLRNQLQVIDTVYKTAGGRGFKVYSYNPSIYDFSYQYLFWWYGTKKYGYQPEDIAYLPNQPEYIKDAKSFWEKTKPADNGLTFLLIEKGDYKELFWSWSGNFYNYCQKDKINFPFNLEIQVLEKCQK